MAGFQRAPGIVRVHDFLEANGTAYIVMELATGETLGSRLQRRELLAAEVERILRALLDGLEKVHAASFIHRDIKPDNILLNDEGQPTLIDFGAARAAVAGRTAALTGIFTPGYAAVEQFTDGRQGPFTDIYALSATLYQSITGEKPPSAIDRMLEDKYIPLAKRRPAGFALALLAGIDRGMAVRPEARPQTIAAWRAALLSWGNAREANPGAGARETNVLAGRRDCRHRRHSRRGRGGWHLFLIALQEAPVTDADRQQVERMSYGRRPGRGRRRREAGEWRRRRSARPRPPLRPPKAAPEEAQRQAATAAAAAESVGPMKRRCAGPRAAAEKQRAEEETQRRAVAEQARRQRAEADARQQAAAREAQRKADEDARATAVAEERRRQAADAELREAARQAAGQEAREKAIAEDSARNAGADAEKAKAEALAARDRKAAEATETALHLGPVDRQRIQVALTAQGFDTRGADGVLGPRSREMVAAWQPARLAGERLPRRGPAAKANRRLGGGGCEVRR